MAAVPAVPLVKLGSTGLEAPVLAYGTGTAWFNAKESDFHNEALVSSVVTAIKKGFRHIDCAEVYNNEHDVGKALKATETPREQLFITSKLFNSMDDPEVGLRKTLSLLGVDQLDLYLVHAPFKFTTTDEMRRAWIVLENCVDIGLTKSLGVSNFRVEDLKTLLSFARIPPVVNQIEFSPYLQSPELVSFCKENNIKVAVYTLLAPITSAAGGPLDPLLDELAARHKRTKAQVLIKWALQKDLMVVTTTGKEERMEEYLQAAGGFELSEGEVESINKLGKEKEFRKYWVEEFGKAKA